MTLSIYSRRDAEQVFEVARKMTLVRKAGIGSDVGQTGPGLGIQRMAGLP